MWILILGHKGLTLTESLSTFEYKINECLPTFRETQQQTVHFRRTSLTLLYLTVQEPG